MSPSPPGVTPVGLHPFCVTPRRRHTTPQPGRGSTYRQRNAVQTKPGTSDLTQGLIGKLFGDKGYVGQDLAPSLLRRGLALMTRVRRNMQRLPVSFLDKARLNGRNIVETIIGHIQEFSSLRLPKHRSVFNAFTHLTAAIVAYQINPLPPKPITASIP